MNQQDESILRSQQVSSRTHQCRDMTQQLEHDTSH